MKTLYDFQLKTDLEMYHEIVDRIFKNKKKTNLKLLLVASAIEYCKEKIKKNINNIINPDNNVYLVKILVNTYNFELPEEVFQKYIAPLKGKVDLKKLDIEIMDDFREILIKNRNLEDFENLMITYLLSMHEPKLYELIYLKDKLLYILENPLKYSEDHILYALKSLRVFEYLLSEYIYTFTKYVTFPNIYIQEAAIELLYFSSSYSPESQFVFQSCIAHENKIISNKCKHILLKTNKILYN